MSLLQKFVSVYIPTYARPQYLRRALQSLANQTYPSIQVLVCEDPSAIDCKQVIKEFQSQFSDFVFLRNEAKSGPCVSRNRMIEAADGEYITGLDDDDLFEQDRIKSFIESPHLTTASFLSSKTAPIVPGENWFPMRDGGRWISFNDMKRANLAGQIFVEKNLFQQCGAFDTTMSAWQDYDAWFRLTKRFGPGYKLDNESYRANFSTDFARITTSSKAHQGFKQFVVKHAEDLSPTDVVYLQLRDYENRGVSVGWKDLARAAAGAPAKDKARVAKDYGKYSFGKNFPTLKRYLLATGFF